MPKPRLTKAACARLQESRLLWHRDRCREPPCARNGKQISADRRDPTTWNNAPRDRRLFDFIGTKFLDSADRKDRLFNDSRLRIFQDRQGKNHCVDKNIKW